MASSLTKYLMVINFRKNPRGSGFFCVEMTWNDPLYNKNNSITISSFFVLDLDTSCSKSVAATDVSSTVTSSGIL